MINQKLAQILSDDFENKIKGVFKKYNLKVNRLDKTNKGRRPDFFVTRKEDEKNGFVCECKFIHSADTIDSGAYHVSTLDIKLASRNMGTFQYDSSDKLEVVIKDAHSQFLSLVKSNQEYNQCPFVIVLELDFFVNFSFIPKDIYGLKKVSAIMKIERDYELKKELKKFNLEELKNIINGKVKKKLPQRSIRFRVLLNSGAKVKFKPNLSLRNPIIEQ